MTAIARRSSIIVGGGLALALAAGSSAAQETARADNSALITRGAQVFSRQCQRCHNPRSPAERTDREWIIIVQHMQLRANLSRDRAEAVRAFLLASNEAAQSPGRMRPENVAAPAETSVTDDMVQQGRAVYGGAGGCVGCHGARLEGGPIAPNLADDRWRNGNGSLAAILHIVRNGVAGTAMAAYPGGISDEEAVRVASYVWAVGRGRAQP